MCMCVYTPWLPHATDSALPHVPRRVCDPCRRLPLWWTRSSPDMLVRGDALVVNTCFSLMQTYVRGQSCSPFSVYLVQTGRSPGRLYGPESVWSPVLCNTTSDIVASHHILTWCSKCKQKKKAHKENGGSEGRSKWNCNILVLLFLYLLFENWLLFNTCKK